MCIDMQILSNIRGNKHVGMLRTAPKMCVCGSQLESNKRSVGFRCLSFSIDDSRQ